MKTKGELEAEIGQAVIRLSEFVHINTTLSGANDNAIVEWPARGYLRTSQSADRDTRPGGRRPEESPTRTSCPVFFVGTASGF